MTFRGPLPVVMLTSTKGDQRRHENPAHEQSPVLRSATVLHRCEAIRERQ